MKSILKAIKKAKVYLMNSTRMHYAIGSAGMLRFIFNPEIDMRSIEQLMALTHYNENLRKELIESVLANEAQRLVVEQRMGIHINLADFATYPKNSLGYQYFNFITQNNLFSYNYPERFLRKCDLYTYIYLHMVNSHDIYHVLLGADVSFTGEGFVASFTIEQLPHYPPPCVHIGIGFIRYAMENGHSYDQSLKVIGNAALMAHEAKDLFCVNWDDYWHEDLESVRKELNIVPYDEAMSRDLNENSPYR